MQDYDRKRFDEEARQHGCNALGYLNNFYANLPGGFYRKPPQYEFHGQEWRDFWQIIDDVILQLELSIDIEQWRQPFTPEQIELLVLIYIEMRKLGYPHYLSEGVSLVI